MPTVEAHIEHTEDQVVWNLSRGIDYPTAHAHLAEVRQSPGTQPNDAARRTAAMYVDGELWLEQATLPGIDDAMRVAAANQALAVAADIQSYAADATITGAALNIRGFYESAAVMQYLSCNLEGRTLAWLASRNLTSENAEHHAVAAGFAAASLSTFERAYQSIKQTPRDQRAERFVQVATAAARTAAMIGDSRAERMWQHRLRRASFLGGIALGHGDAKSRSHQAATDRRYDSRADAVMSILQRP